ncbi:prepilin-type N-terminal cleavage/methylation domain-containing protein, partial [Candidatus Aerophobetes bacterium]
MSNRPGFTLVEAVATLFVITVALLGTVTGFIK